MASALDTPVKAYNDSVRLPAPDLVARLRDLLGAKLVAYLGSVKETRAVRQWAEGEQAITLLQHSAPMKSSKTG